MRVLISSEQVAQTEQTASAAGVLFYGVMYTDISNKKKKVWEEGVVRLLPAQVQLLLVRLLPVRLLLVRLLLLVVRDLMVCADGSAADDGSDMLDCWWFGHA